MPRTCTICGDQLRTMIEAAYAQGESVAVIGRRTNLGEDALRRHLKKHVKPLATDAAGFEAQLDQWLQRINQLFLTASANGELRVQVEAAKSAMAILTQKQGLVDQRIKRESAQKQAASQGFTVNDLDALVRAAESHLNYNQTCSGCGRLGVPYATV
jgi:hypothetical protein